MLEYVYYLLYNNSLLFYDHKYIYWFALNIYFQEIANRQMESVDNNYLRENDPRMPLMQPQRSSRTTFGKS